MVASLTATLIALETNKIENKLKRLNCYESIDDTICECDMYSTIHKAKGLEADAVLAVAENKSRLEKWLMTDKEARCNEGLICVGLGMLLLAERRRFYVLHALRKLSRLLKGKWKGLAYQKSEKRSVFSELYTERIIIIRRQSNDNSQYDLSAFRKPDRLK